MKRKMQIPMQTRQAAFSPATINTDSRSVDLVWTSGAPVKRINPWNRQELIEELNVSGADLSRLNAGANLLDSHSSYSLDRVLGVVEKAWLDKDKKHGYATVRFSEREEVEPIWNDVKAGIIRNVSVGYTVDEAEYIEAIPKGVGPDIFRVLRFTPIELSLVAIPADAKAQVRSCEKTFVCEVNMSDEITEVAETPPAMPDIAVIRRDYKLARSAGANEARAAERSRVRELDELFRLAIFPDDEVFSGLRIRAIDEGWDVEQTRKYLLEVLSDQAEPAFDHSAPVHDDVLHSAPPVRHKQTALPGSRSERRVSGRLEVTRDAVDTTAQSIEQALLIRCGIEKDQAVIQDARQRGMAGLSYVEMGRQLFRATGQEQRIAGLDKHGVAKIMLTRAGPMTASDFTGILANVATKIAKKGYLETPTTYQDWCNIGYLPDFKPATIPGLGAFSDLDQIPSAGGPYVFGTFGDNYETATLATYGKLFGISRQALVNDDLNLFSRTGTAMGSAAARKVNSLAYAVLTANQTMTEDSTALFHADHANFIAQGSGAAPSIATLNAAETAMAVQTAPKQATDSTAAYLNLTPAHLIVPVSLSATARTLMTSQYDPAGTTASVSRRDAPNIWRDRLKITVDAALGTAAATGWYLAAAMGNAVVDTVTVFFLEGSGGTPYTEEQAQFDSDGVWYKVRIDAVARALDFRGLYFNYGA